MTSIAVASDQPPRPEAERHPLPAVPQDSRPMVAHPLTGPDDLDRRDAVALLADVVMNRRVETPMAIGLFGPAGSGKSRFMRSVVDHAAQLAAGSAAAAASPFVSRVVTARAEATPGRAPAALLVEAVVTALADHHAAFAEDAIHASGDPREAARLTGERLNGLRRTLDGERQALAGLEDRRARLTDTVLFDAAGSRVDGFARSHRGRIDARLRAFGVPAADPVRTFKEWVRDSAGPSGGGARIGLALRALWAFKGQGLLLGLAVLLALLGWAAGAGANDPDAVSAWLAGFGDRFAALTDWSRAHLDLLQPVSRIAWALAVLAILADVVRAARFLGPIFKGIALLNGEIDGRRRDLDGLLAHQTRRVDDLAAEAEAAARSADAAQRRAERRHGTGLSEGSAALAGERFGLAPSPETAAERFFAELGTSLAENAAGAPERIVVALDGLERLSATEAATVLATAHRMLGRPGFVTLVTLDREQMATALGEFDPALAAARLDRALQLSYDLGLIRSGVGALAARLLDPGAREDVGKTPPDPLSSALDRPLQPFETDLVRTLASFAGGTPRAVRRFVDSYRVARADARVGSGTPAVLGALALALALDGTGAASELSAFDGDLARGHVKVDLGSDVGRAFEAVAAVIGRDATAEDLRRGLAVARRYSRWGW